MRQWVLFSGFTNVKMEVSQGRIQEFVQGGGLAPIAPPLEYASDDNLFFYNTFILQYLVDIFASWIRIQEAKMLQTQQIRIQSTACWN